MTYVPTILIAEDVAAVRHRLKRQVESMGYPTQAVVDGAAAIKALRTNHDIRIALVDWNMPCVDGVEVCRYVRTLDRLVYVIVVTGRRSDGDLAHALENGANDYLTKPVRQVELQARIHAARRMVEFHESVAQLQRLETLGQLAAGIAHEINTPTQFVGDNLTFVENVWGDLEGLLKQCKALDSEVDGDADPAADRETIIELARCARDADLDYVIAEVPHAIEQSKLGVERIARIVRAMKQSSQVRSTEKVLANVNSAIEGTVVLSRNEWKYAAKVDLDLDPQLPEVECCIGELNQAILNVIVNAAHAIGEGRREGQREMGRITIRTREVDESVEIVVEDDGPGVPEHVAPHLFERFFTTKPIGKGTGQGLAIARELVEDRHGGSIGFECPSEGGTRFSIRVPISARDSAREEAEEETTPSLAVAE